MNAAGAVELCELLSPRHAGTSCACSRVAEIHWHSGAHRLH